MNNYNNNNEHESIELNIYRDYDYFNCKDYDIIYDNHNYQQDNIIKDKTIEKIFDKEKLLKEKKEVLIDLAEDLTNYYFDFENDYTQEQLVDFIIDNIWETTLNTQYLVEDFNIEKYFLEDYKIYEVCGYCQGDLTYFIDIKGLDENKLQNMLYNSPLSICLEIDNEVYYESDFMSDICYDIDILKENAIKFLKEKKYSEYVIDFVNNNFREY